MRNICFRFFNVYGPRQLPDHEYAAVLPKFLGNALLGEPLMVHGDGEQSRDFVFVKDVAQILSATVLKGFDRQEVVYNLAFGDVHSVNAVAHRVLTVAGRAVPIVHGTPRPGDIRSSQANHDRLAALFPEFTPTAFADGVAATAAWLTESLTNQQFAENPRPLQDQDP
jgi:UDP-glucose 4-epimerase